MVNLRERERERERERGESDPDVSDWLDDVSHNLKIIDD